MKIFLDDVRIPEDCAKYMHTRIGSENLKYFDKDWEIAKNYEEFIELVEDCHLAAILVTHVSFDHDLADEHYDPSMMVEDGDYNALYDTFKERTGKECAEFMKNYYKEKNIPLPTVFIHTMNPVGRINIENVFKT